MSRQKISLVLAVLMLAASVSCGSEGTPEQSSAADTSAETTEAPVTEALTGREAAKNDLPDNLDFGGETLTLLSRASAAYLAEFDAESENGDIINDTVYKRNRYACETLNCELEVISREGDWGQHNNFVSTVVNEVAAGDTTYDVISYYAYASPMLATQGVLKNLHDVEYLNLEQPWWHRLYIENAEVYGKLYTVAGDICLSTVSNRYAIFFNQRIADEYLDENLYELVDSGKWTMDKFVELSSNLFIDLDGDTVSEESDLLALDIMFGYHPFAAGAGLTYTKRTSDGEYEWDYYNEKNITIIDKFYELFNQSSTFYKEDYAVPDNFIDCRRLFHMNKLELTEKLRDMPDEYGILPYPKYDESQESYYSMASDNFSLIMVPTTCEDTKLVGAWLELAGEYSYKYLTPAWLEVAMKGKYLRDGDSVRMFDIIMEGSSYDFAFINAPVIGNPTAITLNSMRRLGGDFASQYAANESKLKTSLENLLELYKNS